VQLAGASLTYAHPTGTGGVPRFVLTFLERRDFVPLCESPAQSSRSVNCSVNTGPNRLCPRWVDSLSIAQQERISLPRPRVKSSPFPCSPQLIPLSKRPEPVGHSCFYWIKLLFPLPIKLPQFPSSAGPFPLPRLCKARKSATSFLFPQFLRGFSSENDRSLDPSWERNRGLPPLVPSTPVKEPMC